MSYELNFVCAITYDLKTMIKPILKLTANYFSKDVLYTLSPHILVSNITWTQYVKR